MRRISQVIIGEDMRRAGYGIEVCEVTLWDSLASQCWLGHADKRGVGAEYGEVTL